MKHPQDPKYNHCLKKEIMALEKNVDQVVAPKSKLLTNGEARLGTPVEIFVKLVESRDFRGEYALHTLVDREGNIVTFYGTVKNTPVKMEDVSIGDCIKVKGRIAKYGQWGGENQTRISHVKILYNKGMKS